MRVRSSLTSSANVVKDPAKLRVHNQRSKSGHYTGSRQNSPVEVLRDGAYCYPEFLTLMSPEVYRTGEGNTKFHIVRNTLPFYIIPYLVEGRRDLLCLGKGLTQESSQCGTSIHPQRDEDIGRPLPLDMGSTACAPLMQRRVIDGHCDGQC